MQKFWVLIFWHLPSEEPRLYGSLLKWSQHLQAFWRPFKNYPRTLAAFSFILFAVLLPVHIVLKNKKWRTTGEVSGLKQEPRALSSPELHLMNKSSKNCEMISRFIDIFWPTKRKEGPDILTTRLISVFSQSHSDFHCFVRVVCDSASFLFIHPPSCSSCWWITFTVPWGISELSGATEKQVLG